MMYCQMLLTKTEELKFHQLLAQTALTKSAEPSTTQPQRVLIQTQKREEIFSL